MMFESPSTLESPRDPFTGALWWTESSFDGSPGRNGSFARVQGNLRRQNESTDRSGEPDLSTDTARKKLTWISREDLMSSSGSSNLQNMLGNDRLSALGRSGRLGGADSPQRVIHSPAGSPVRRGESVRRIRTPSMDSVDTSRVPSSATAGRRLQSLNHAPRSASFKEGSVAAASAVSLRDHTVIKEASALRRGLTSTSVVRDQRTAPKPRVPHPTTDECSPEVVSYLAEETDRIIKERIQKLTLRFHSNTPNQPETGDHKRNSAEEARKTNGSGRWTLSDHFDNSNRDQVRVGDRELDYESRNSPASNVPGSPSLPISPLLPQYSGCSTAGEVSASPSKPTISATMENYLDNRRRGLNTGPHILVNPRPTAAPILLSASASCSNVAVRRQPADESENPSSSSNVNRVGRHESFAASSRAALSPINGNEDVTHSTTSFSQRKGNLYSTGELRTAGQDPNIRRSQRKEYIGSPKIGRDSTVSVQQIRRQHQGENGFPSREHWAPDFVRNGAEMASGEMPLRQFSKHSEKRNSPSAPPSARKELGTKPGFQSNGGVHSSQKDRTPVGGSARYPAVSKDLLGQSQRYEPEIGKSLLSVGFRDKLNASRRSQSCRRDLIVKSLLDPSQDNEPHPLANGRNKPSALPGGCETSSSDPRNSTRSSVSMRVTNSSSDPLPKPSSRLLSQVEKQKFPLTDLSDHKSTSRRISTAVPESRAGSRRFSVAGVPESGGNPLSLSSGKPSSVGGPEVAGGSPSPSSRRYYSVAAGPELCRSPVISYSQPLHGSNSPIIKAKHQRMDKSSHTKSGGPQMDLPILDSQLSAKKKNAVQLERPKMSHRSSSSLDQQDMVKRLFVHTKKESQNGQPVTTSTSISQACSIPSPMIVAKPQPLSSPGSSFQRWFANQFKVGSKSRSSSTGKDRDPQAEPKLRKKSPWRTKSAEILQGITRKKGSSPLRPAAPSVDANSLQHVQQGNTRDGGTPQSPLTASEPWHHGMIHLEASSTPPHRKFYALPSVSAMSPARTPGLQSQLKHHLRH